MGKMMSGVLWYDRSASKEFDGSVGDVALRTLGEDEKPQVRPMPAGLSRLLKNGADAAMPLGVPIGFAMPGFADDRAVDRGSVVGLESLVASTRQPLVPSSPGSNALSAAVDVTSTDLCSASVTDSIAAGKSESAGLRSIGMAGHIAAAPAALQSQRGASYCVTNVAVGPFGRMPADEPREPLGFGGDRALSAAVGAATPRDALRGVAIGQVAFGWGAAGSKTISGAAQGEAADGDPSGWAPVSLSGVPLSGNASLLAAQSDNVGNGDRASARRWVGSGPAGVDIVPRRISAAERSSADTSSVDSGGRSTPPPTTRAWFGNESGKSGQASGRQTGQELNAGSMVALRGDVLMDGRKMGRIVAAGQTSAASLPGVSSSAVNLRAMPVFSGTSVPL